MCDSNLQDFLQSRAGGLFVLVEGMGINVQRSRGLAVAEDARYRGHVRTACDHQTGGGVPERMDVQLLRQAVLLEDQLEAVGEGGGRHGELRSLTAEQEVISGQLPLVIGFGDIGPPETDEPLAIALAEGDQNTDFAQRIRRMAVWG